MDAPAARAAAAGPTDPGAPPPLYATRQKVYPRSVSGRWRQVKWTVLVACLALYYVGPWLRWDRGPNAPDQALLIDMAGRRAYFFWIEIWPQEVYYITGLLILGALALFLATSLFGRVWCGYACPQTVWTDLFMLVERWIEGDRSSRIRLDQARLSAGKALRKGAKHAAWLAIALATGGAWALYFNDAPTAVREFFTGQAGAGLYFFVGLFTVTTYVLAGWAREQVCTYMCPWPRFQAAMFDEHSFIVTYRAWRGEPRGAVRRNAAADGKHGDCIDCGACVHVCPTGIDIRNGPQLQCIGCGLCVDACNAVMDNVGKPRGLVDFATLAADTALARGQRLPYRLVRPRTIVYAVLLAVVAGVMAFGLSSRTTVELNVLRDRMPQFVTLADGSIRNGYTIKVLNKTRAPVAYRLAASGLSGAVLLDADGGAVDTLRIAVPPDTVGVATVFLKAAAGAPDGFADVRFTLRDDRGAVVARRDSVFASPRR